MRPEGLIPTLRFPFNVSLEMVSLTRVLEYDASHCGTGNADTPARS